MLPLLASPPEAVRWLRARSRGTLRTDSRRLQPGDAFIAWPGHASDGRRHVGAALAAGADACLVEAEDVAPYGFDDPRIAALTGLKAATGAVADAWFGEPSRRLQIVATTGTNGKTSTAWWTAQALSLLGRRCGIVGTLGIGVPPVGRTPASLEPTGLTTPDPVTLQAALRRMVDDGHAACAVEASSIGLVEHRLDATRIAVALFTNFTRDHLDFHRDMASYWAAKRRLFDCPGLQAAVVNLDDPQGLALAAELAGRPLALWTTSLADPRARLRAGPLQHDGRGLAFTLHEGASTAVVHSRLIGDFNAANLLTVLGGLRALGVPLADAVSVLPQLTPVPGRLERVMLAPRSPTAAAPPPAGGEHCARARTDLDAPEVVVDYAHTPDALEKVLAALRPLAAARGGRLVCVFGCGGNRDASKRPLMGAIAERLADRVLLTSDNPRHEDPQAILEQIAAGLASRDSAEVVVDRRAAIALAVARADVRDVLLIAGKGHEDVQEVAGQRLPFCDVTEARHALAVRRTAPGGRA